MLHHLLRPTRICALCHQSHHVKKPICDDCDALLVPMQDYCMHCAECLTSSESPICGRCIKKKPMIDNICAAFAYQEPLRQLLHRYKYQESLFLTAFIGDAITQRITPELRQTQCLIPIPMHRKRIQERGFNQAAEMCTYLSKQLNIPKNINACSKMVNTKPQASLKASDRATNLKDVFKAQALTYHHITLIDDLYTTGHTANALAGVFKKQGIARVDLWCFARA